MSLFPTHYTTINDNNYVGQINFASSLRGRMNDSATINPQREPSAGLLYHFAISGGTGTGVPGHPNGIYGEPLFAEAGPSVRADGVLVFSLLHAPFRITELDREWMFHLGDAIASATLTVSIPSVQISHRGLFMGHPDNLPAGYTVAYTSGEDHVTAYKDADVDTVGSVRIGLLGIFINGNGDPDTRLMWTSNVSAELTANGATSIAAADFVRAYFTGCAGNAVFFEMVVLPNISGVPDASANDSMGDDMWALHQWMLPFGAMTHNAAEYRDYGLLTWKDVLWSSIAIRSLCVDYAGGWTLPSRCRLMAAPLITRQD